MKRTPDEILRSIVADVEAMLNPGPVRKLGYSDADPTDHQPKDFFGPFINYVDELDDGGACMVDGGRVTVEWPNLRLLLDEANQLLNPVPPAPRMTAGEFLVKFPNEDTENGNCLEDMACQNCGQRAELRISGTVQAKMFDDGTDSDESDFEYDGTDRCWCPECNHKGTIDDFTFKGLDDLIARKRQNEG